jgi:hypothetical protein
MWMDRYCGSELVRNVGRYTALDNPVVDQTVEDHLQRIVAAVTSRIRPQAIILRGSFSQGEGSVMVEGAHLRFLSDYELMAVTPHYQHRKWLRSVAQEMTARLGVETSISRVHPENIMHNSLGNRPIKSIARPTIGMYEVQNGGCTLYGANLLNHGPAIDPRNLDIWTGLRLMLNRMAESLSRLSDPHKSWDTLRWVNKTELSCADALLIAHGQYHFSYEERGRRFADLVPEVDAVTQRASHLSEMVRRATLFKLRPSLDLYPEPMPLIWRQVKQACDATFRYVTEKGLGFSFDDYAEFPQRYLSQLRALNKLGKSPLPPLPTPLAQNLFLMIRLLRARRLPPPGLITHATYPAHQIAFSVIPLAFLGDNEEVLQEAHRWLETIRPSKAPRGSGTVSHWHRLQAQMMQAWKDYCYGMWA